MKRTTKRVLIYRLGSLGDMVVALPALHLVARVFPDAERRMLTNLPVSSKAPAAAAVLGDSGLVTGYMRYVVGTRNAGAIIALWWTLLRWQPEVLVYLTAARGIRAARRDAWFFRICGVRRMVGVPLTQAEQDCAIDADGELESEASHLVRNLKELGTIDLEDPSAWDLHLAAAEQARAEAVLAPIAHLPMIAVSVGTKVQAKDWGVANWRQLLSQVAALCPGHALVLCGAAEEAAASEYAAEGWVGAASGLLKERAAEDYPAMPVINLCGHLTPRESAAVFARARIFLGHDSGPMHLAASVGTPCVAVFAARNMPRQWFPYGRQHRVIYHAVSCQGCALETCILEKRRCLTSIKVPEVLAATSAVLAELQVQGSNRQVSAAIR